MLSQSNKTVAASSLVLSVVISLLIFLLTSAFILLSYNQRKFQQIHDIDYRLNKDLRSTINLVIADTSFNEDNRTFPDLFDNDTAFVERYKWGLYEVASIKVSSGRFNKSKILEYGSSLPDSMNACLYLIEHQRPLSLIGHSTLIGDAYVSRQGLRPGYINSRGFDYPELIKGNIHESATNINFISDQQKYYLDKLTDPSTLIGGSYLPDSAIKTFAEPASELSIKGPIQITDQKFEGRIVVRSDTMIEVGRDCILNNIILIAPVIKVHSGFSGVVQLFASQEILIEKDCTLKYPSAVVLIKKEKTNEQPAITVGKNSRISGVILSLASDDDQYKTKAEVQESSLITGVLLVRGYLSLSGSVNGMVITDFFIYKNGSSTYENFLVDVNFNRKSLSGYFVGPSFFNRGETRKIIQWLP